jgi:hypothetical protein
VNSTDLVLRFIDLLDQFAIPYMLVGSYSSNYYGRPRSTKDADFVLTIRGDQLTQLQKALGHEFHVDQQLSFEAITMTTYYVITHPATAFKLDLFLLSDDAHGQEEFRRRRQVDFEGHSTWLPSPEDVIIQKLRWSQSPGRVQDLPDAAHVLRIQRPLGLDVAYIRHWCDQHGTRGLFEDLLADIPRN